MEGPRGSLSSLKATCSGRKERRETCAGDPGGMLSRWEKFLLSWLRPTTTRAQHSLSGFTERCVLSEPWRPSATQTPEAGPRAGGPQTGVFGFSTNSRHPSAGADSRDADPSLAQRVEPGPCQNAAPESRRALRAGLPCGREGPAAGAESETISPRRVRKALAVAASSSVLTVHVSETALIDRRRCSHRRARHLCHSCTGQWRFLPSLGDDVPY